ncbi:long-chain-fatty-acid--CoA ligase [Mycobacterium timonense]|uniref:Long-chain-fatty-acid--CoA ligase FadD13 n=2 Tax=Mycobacterium avium complex (MAC) TaxID=120793 RepID=A0AAW5S5M9_MYCBC|nr:MULTISPECIES: long-chain-fatty-acid--CoA ligase [Mycobacterium avium complex (MAC)]KDO97190.1 AMP-dependent synthetase [Mycobacterium avium subsp. hominissuis 3388]MBZ4551430.1 long-chain fatty acid--CoA ligase [Mycobacterium avium subsp. hominissuis]MBZ4597394.1 long-chain fatty acid--CoA ligase [Mycobacterium avium subsp. hominissuis]MBZ4613505.1 long-chain fatty acid--CoA ligase [Mycobacterium avium subsp. hominissuis]MCV6990305.1 long-chain-fatty-acid--CoA ligase [Mycobacterium bouchedu
MPAAETRETLAGIVERHAQRRPDAIAIRYGERQWSWAEWSSRIRRAAGALRGAGIQRGQCVAFLDKNHPACLEVLIGGASVGAVTTVVNWRVIGDELVHVLADSGARVLVVGAELRPAAEAAARRVPSLERIIEVGDEYESLLAAAEPAPSDAGVDTDETALVIYSSGTTGRPKGVLLSQRALVNHAANLAPAFPFGDGDANLVAMPLFHVGGIGYALFGIRAGAPTIMTREPDAAALIGAVRAGATHAFFVPPVIARFLDAGEAARASIAGLRYIVYGAAPMPLPLLHRALSTWPGTKFVQVYGQTELCGAVTALSDDDHRDAARPQLQLSAGKAVQGCEIRIVDPGSGAELPAGRSGEVWVRSNQNMSGYLNRAEATAETITADGWVRTGDVGRLDADGYVYIEDRLKDMIITGGENVYGPEVESVLIEHPAVVDAAVIGVPDDFWGESVKAIVVADGDVDAADVIEFCRRHLAGFKCPRTVDFVAELPRNASGKILKTQLREPFWRDRDRRV